MFVGLYIIGQNLAQTLRGECMVTLTGETLSIAVLDSQCTTTVCCKTWLNCDLESLSLEELNNIKREPSEAIFKFGNGNEKVCHSLKWITIPVVIAWHTYHKGN